MLVIRRRAGESFLIDGDIEVEVLEVSGTQVKLGIRAPKETLILRREVHLTAHQNKVASRGISLQGLASLAGKLRRE
jgi:carbon storage regulator